MSRPLACLMSSLMLATALPAAAQTPSGLGDLVGARAGQAEGELNRRGYQPTDRSEVVGDGRMTYWRNGADCVSIMTRDGRYVSINQAGRSECGSGGSDRWSKERFRSWRPPPHCRSARIPIPADLQVSHPEDSEPA